MSLSIIIPVHNTEQYLAECLDSVLSEINSEDEIILVENGSTDHSWEMCLEFAEKYKIIKAVTMEIAGVSKARNYGISLAKGDWIMFLDSDDCIDPAIIHTAHELKENSDIEVVLFRYCYLDSGHSNDKLVSNELKHVDSNLLRRGALEFGKYEKQITESSPLDNMSIWTCWGKLFKKRLLDDKKIRFPERLSWSEDTAFVFQVYCSTDKVYGTQRIAYYYRETPDSASRNVTFKSLSNNRYLRKWTMHYVLGHGLEIILEEEISSFLVRKFIEECLYLIVCNEKSRNAKIRYTKRNAEEPYMKKALQKADSRWLIPGKRNTLLYGAVLWLIKRKCYAVLYIN